MNALPALAAAGGAVALLGSVAVRFPAWARLDPNVEHAPVVVAAAGWMAWRRLVRGLPAAGPPSPLGVPLLVSTALLSVAGWFAEIPWLEWGGAAGALLAALAAAGGAAFARVLAFPVLFLGFAAPLPAEVYQPIALGLQGWVCGLSAWLLRLLGVGVFRQGSLLQLSGHALDVGAACAGVRQATAYLALTLAAGHLSGRGWAYRIALAAAALPVALAANTTRVLLTAAIVLRTDPRFAQGLWHDLEGATLVALGAALVFLTARALAAVDVQGFAVRETGPPPLAPARDASARAAGWRPAAAVLLAAVLGKAALAYHLGPSPAEAAHPPARLASSLPLALGGWRGTELPVPAAWGTGEDRCYRRYRHGVTGQAVVVWADHSSRGADRAHHPEVCLAVAGMREERGSRREVALPGQPHAAQEYRFVGPHGSESVYYWHYTLPRPAVSAAGGLRQLRARLTTPAASLTLEVFAPAQRADRAAVVPFLEELDAVVRAQLPAGSVRGRERRPVFLVNGPHAGVWE